MLNEDKIKIMSRCAMYERDRAKMICRLTGIIREIMSG